MRVLSFCLLALILSLCLQPLIAEEAQPQRGMQIKMEWDEQSKSYQTRILLDPTLDAAATPATAKEVPELIAQLEGNDEHEVMLAVLRLSRSGKVSVPALRKALRSTNVQVQMMTALALSLIDTPSARVARRETPLEPFLLWLQHKDELNFPRFSGHPAKRGLQS